MVGQVRYAFVPEGGGGGVANSTMEAITTASVGALSPTTAEAIAEQGYTPIEVVVTLTFTVGVIQIVSWGLLLSRLESCMHRFEFHFADIWYTTARLHDSVSVGSDD